MHTPTPTALGVETPDGRGGPFRGLLAYLPRGNTLDERSFQRRHRFLIWVLALHLPVLAVLGLALGNSPLIVGYALIGPVTFLVLGRVLRARRLASFCVTGGLVFCSAGLVVLTSGTIEAHFHFFIIIGFIALYQDWVPFLWNVAFTGLSHGIGTIWLGGDLIFNHPAAQQNPWLWSGIHAFAVLFACFGMVVFWRITEEEQTEKEALGRRLLTADAEIDRRQFTADMLVNLARRNQSMLYRQLDIINQLEEKERDPDTLSELFTLDHLATRVRRNAESLLVLAGEQPPRTWTAAVPLRDVVRAAIAETEDLDRVVFAIDDGVAVSGQCVADLTHLLAELTENAVRFSPPDTAVTIRARADRRDGGYFLTIEDWGVGMPPADLAAANDLLARPREVDLAVAQRLGFHVVARLAARHRITVSLGNTPGSGVTGVVALPAALFTAPPVEVGAPPVAPAGPRSSLRGRESQPESGLPVRPVREPAAPSEPPAAAGPSGTGGFAPFADADGAGPAATDDWRGWWSPDRTEATTGPVPHDRRPAEPAVGAGAPPAADAVAENAVAEDAVAENGAAVQPAAEDTVTDERPRPTPRPRPEGEIPPPRPEAGTGGEGRRPTLRRRVPQAHLAPELRLQAADETQLAAPPDGGAAASALSRYQASRQAAQAIVDDAEGSRS